MAGNCQCRSFTWCPGERGPVSKCVSHVFLLGWRRQCTSLASPVIPGVGSISLILTYIQVQLPAQWTLPSSSAAGREPGHTVLVTTTWPWGNSKGKKGRSLIWHDWMLFYYWFAAFCIHESLLPSSIKMLQCGWLLASYWYILLLWWELYHQSRQY